MSGNDFTALGQYGHLDDMENSFPLSNNCANVTQQDSHGDTQIQDIDLDSTLAYCSANFEALQPRSIPAPYNPDRSRFSETEDNLRPSLGPHYTCSTQLDDSWSISFVDQTQFSDSTPAWTSLQATGFSTGSLRDYSSHGQQEQHTRSLPSTHFDFEQPAYRVHLTDHAGDFLYLSSIHDPVLHSETVRNHLNPDPIPTVSPSQTEDLMSQPPDRDQISLSSLQCAECDFTATNPSSLKKHRAAHEKANLCPEKGCEHAEKGNGFCNNNDLTRHMWSKHNIGGRPLYICCFGDCQSYVTRKDNFRDHLRRCHSITDDAEAYCKNSMISPDDERYVAALDVLKRRAKDQRSKPTTTSSMISKASVKKKKRSSSRRSKPSKVDPNEPKVEMDAEDDLMLSPLLLGGLQEASQQRQVIQSAGEQFADQMPSWKMPQKPPYRGAQYQTWSSAASAAYLNPMPAQQYPAPQLAEQPAFCSQPSVHKRNGFHDEPGSQHLQQQQQQQRHYLRPHNPYMSSTLENMNARRISAPTTWQSPSLSSFKQPLPLNLPLDDLVQDVSIVLKDHDKLKSFRQTPELQHVPHWPQHAMTAPTDVLGADDATELSPHDEVRTHVGHIDDLTVITGKPYQCPVCAKPFHIESALTKHMKRHDRPWICMWDDCRDNKLSGLAQPYTSNDLGWACQGSKYDQARHEKTVHVEKGQVVDCYRCTGHNDHGMPCHRLYSPANANEYLNHLLNCGFTPRAAERAMETSFIPANFQGRFWCGFCDAIIPNSPIELLHAEDTRRSGGTKDPPTDKQKVDLYLDERRQHIMNHIQNGGMKGQEGAWRYLNGRGLTKFDLDTARRDVTLKEKEKKGKDKSRASM